MPPCTIEHMTNDSSIPASVFDLDFDLESPDITDVEVAVFLVTRAAGLAAHMREEGLGTEFKTSVSDVVTEADRAAEEFVVNALAQLRPEDGILGEEGSSSEGTSGRVWVIDPVDGTYNFTSGSDYWCSAIALIEGPVNNPERVILGAVHQTSSGRTWVGGPELPTVVHTLDIGSSDPIAVEPVSGSDPAQISVGTYLHGTYFRDAPNSPVDAAIASRWAETVGLFATWRTLGSASLDMAGVADGRIGAWFQRTVAPWDWLPGYALVAGAGGVGDLMDSWRIAGHPEAVAQVASSLEP